jgi:Tol biopolymer transport system component
MAGVILGTAAYMSPEQARGQDADRRADVWAFGVVLYEMLTGRELFTGPTVSDTLAAVLKTELDLSTVPEPVRPIIERCLRKEPRRRWQAIGDVRLALEEHAAVATAPASVPAPQSRPRLPWLLAAMLAAALLTLALFHFREAPLDLVLQLLIEPPEKASFGSSAISPDGRLLAFTVSGGDRALWVRRLDSSTPHALSGTEGASFRYTPFWSPDSRHIGFFTDDGKLKRVDLSGGPVQTLASAPGPRGGTWNRDGTIVFAPGVLGSLSVVSAAGGDPKALTHLDASRLENSHRWPSFLPDGRHFLYVVQSLRPENSGIFLQSLDSTNRIRLLADVSNSTYAGGYLLFARAGTLIAQRFDVGKLRLTGEPFPITGRVGLSGIYAHAEYSVSTNGFLVYNPSDVGSGYQWTWFDRGGKRLAAIGEPGSQLRGQLSPDEKQVAIDRLDPQLGTYDLWLIDSARGTSSRFTFDPGTEWYPVWSPDGARIAFASNRAGAFDIYAKVSSGVGKEELLLKSDVMKYPTDWSRDGRFLLYTQNSPKTLNDIWVLSLADQKATPFLQTEYSERDGVFSPDGKWIAYTSDESGKEEVYVKAFPASQAYWQISKGGGSRSRWNRNGKELFYLAPDGKIMAVEVKNGVRVQAGVPQPLLETHVTSGATKFAVTDDGRRFLIPSPVPEARSPITVVFNWTKSIQP